MSLTKPGYVNCVRSEASPRNWSVGKIMFGKTEVKAMNVPLALYTSHTTPSTAIDGDAQQEAYE